MEEKFRFNIPRFSLLCEMRTSAAANKIKALSNEELSAPVSELVESVYNEFRLVTPVLDRENIEMDEKEVVEEEIDPRRHPVHRTIRQTKTKLIFIVPYTGDKEFLTTSQGHLG